MKRRCFTLIELLVVIAVIALLLAILIPVLHSVRQRTRALACSSRIRALTFGLIMYENKDKAFPYGFFDITSLPPDDYIGNAGQDRMGKWWFQFIDEFIKKSNIKTTVHNCPSKRLNNPRLKNNILCGNYGVNLSICKISNDIPSKKEFVGAPLGLMDIPQPSRTLLIVDSGYSIISWWHAADVPPATLNGNMIEDTAYVPGLMINKDKNLKPGQEQDAIDGRHPNKTVNVGFADGHVARKKADDLFVEKNAETYTNKIPLWSPK
jgi:prepilin-type processing-associated H-X9-DG protein/prepilin-type N-terminal cleavage/methylation domain-containing protein